MSVLRSISRLGNLKGKRVLLRVDFNVPVKRGRVLEDEKIRASLPTIVHLLHHKARVIVMTHLGRPEGKIIHSLRVDPVVTSLSALLGRRVKKIDTKNWRMSQKKQREIQQQLSKMHDSDIVVLENTRFAKEEEVNSGDLAARMASLGDLVVLDGFAVAHRDAASVSGIAEFLPSYAGLLLEKEIKGLKKVFQGKSPFVVIMGGVKTETKIPVIDHLLPLADTILLGGAIVNTCLHAMGYGLGSSIVDKDSVARAVRMAKKKKIILPVDVIVGDKKGSRYRVVPVPKKPTRLCEPHEAILDIGPESIRLFASYIKKAQTIVWNGAMGYFEQKPYHVGTVSIARLVASRAKGKAYGVIGGGETIQAMQRVHMADSIDFISTGGGAMLEFLSGKKLPGIEALTKKKK